MVPLSSFLFFILVCLLPVSGYNVMVVCADSHIRWFQPVRQENKEQGLKMIENCDFIILPVFVKLKNFSHLKTSGVIYLTYKCFIDHKKPTSYKIVITVQAIQIRHLPQQTAQRYVLAYLKLLIHKKTMVFLSPSFLPPFL